MTKVPTNDSVVLTCETVLLAYGSATNAALLSLAAFLGSVNACIFG